MSKTPGAHQTMKLSPTRVAPIFMESHQFPVIISNVHFHTTLPARRLPSPSPPTTEPSIQCESCPRHLVIASMNASSSDAPSPHHLGLLQTAQWKCESNGSETPRYKRYLQLAQPSLVRHILTNYSDVSQNGTVPKTGHFCSFLSGDSSLFKI
jgi:hypothetical protein